MSETTAEPDPEDVRIGATITALRLAHELSITELARAIDVSRQLIGLIESGHRHASMAHCRAIARTLNVPVAAITVQGYEQIKDAC